MKDVLKNQILERVSNGGSAFDIVNNEIKRWDIDKALKALKKEIGVDTRLKYNEITQIVAEDTLSQSDKERLDHLLEVYQDKLRLDTLESEINRLIRQEVDLSRLNLLEKTCLLLALQGTTLSEIAKHCYIGIDAFKDRMQKVQKKIGVTLTKIFRKNTFEYRKQLVMRENYQILLECYPHLRKQVERMCALELPSFTINKEDTLNSMDDFEKATYILLNNGITAIEIASKLCISEVHFTSTWISDLRQKLNVPKKYDRAIEWVPHYTDKLSSIENKVFNFYTFFHGEVSESVGMEALGIAKPSTMLSIRSRIVNKLLISNTPSEWPYPKTIPTAVIRTFIAIKHRGFTNLNEVFNNALYDEENQCIYKVNNRASISIMLSLLVRRLNINLNRSDGAIMKFNTNELFFKYIVKEIQNGNAILPINEL